MSTDHQLPPLPADRQLLELHALRQRQLRTAFLHGRRRTWRERRRIWPAVVVALVLIALLVAGTSVAEAFHRQQEISSGSVEQNPDTGWTRTADQGILYC